jgi:aminopeptidase N
VGFALENQTRPTYSPFFFFGGPADWVVVHELAHQWYGDSLALYRWQHIWLNEGFATYAEWLWSEREGDATAQEIFDSLTLIPRDDFFWELEIGDPGPIALFDFPVYARGAMTLHALRTEVGDDTFFAILQAWSRTQRNGTVTTREFIRLAERLSGQQLDDLFDVWLSAGKPAGLPEPPPEDPMSPQRRTPTATGTNELPDAVRSLAERLKDRPRNPFVPAS